MSLIYIDDSNSALSSEVIFSLFFSFCPLKVFFISSYAFQSGREKSIFYDGMKGIQSYFIYSESIFADVFAIIDMEDPIERHK